MERTRASRALVSVLRAQRGLLRKLYETDSTPHKHKLHKIKLKGRRDLISPGLASKRNGKHIHTTIEVTGIHGPQPIVTRDKL